ncbi:histidine kinase 3-like [Hibiscus syriacus]|uniref:histidine kinase 3-like n=1 Tax=Hibiscus syriacus TaxID=106335 RepID=UPI00192293A3|nr:histidine kinase 3-like [Hibiscus syriacus]
MFFGFGLKVGHLVWMLCCLITSTISMNWFINGEFKDPKGVLLGDSGSKMWFKCWDEIFKFQLQDPLSVLPVYWFQESLQVMVERALIFMDNWLDLGFHLDLLLYELSRYRKSNETLASMCDERDRMLQDQFNVSMNHIQAMSILISTFNHGKTPSAIDQRTFARYTQRMLSRGPSQEEYAPVRFALDIVSHVISLVYKRDLPSNATPNERIQATDGYVFVTNNCILNPKPY